MPDSVKHISSDTHPAFVLYLMMVSAWPDVAYIDDAVFGFRIVGDVRCPPVFRATKWDLFTWARNEHLEGADKFVDDLVASLAPNKDPSVDSAMLDLSAQDIGRFAPRPLCGNS